MSASPSMPTARSIPFIIKPSSRSISITSPVVTNIHGQQWMEELKTMCEAAGSRLASGQKELARVEDANVTTPKPHLHEGDLYLGPESLDAFQGALGGVLDAVDLVFERQAVEQSSTTRKAFVCVRPPGHHCAADLPSGFCWLNNVHVGIEHAVQAHGLTHAAIIDFDLHHGDGSQSITWQRNAKAWHMAKNVSVLKKTAIGYFSLHDINSYPCEDGDTEKVQAASLCIENAHGQTVWNVHLQAWKTEAEFWEIYRTRYLTLLEKTRVFLRGQVQRVRAAPGNVHPKAAIFISAGFDASEYEGEGMQRHKVNVPTEFYARFTSDIVKLAEEEGMATEGRVISVLEGGYSDRALASGALSHLVGLVGPSEAMSNASNHVRRSSLGNLDNVFPTSWWNTLAMTELESLVTKSQGQPKRSRLSDVVTHASPTESFLAKVIDPSKLSKGPPPPPPIVDWATAAFELSKLLVPSDRQVNSHRPEELTEPRLKKERLSSSIIPSTEQNGEKMQLRGRRSKEAPIPPVNNVTLPLRTARPMRKSTEGFKPSRNSLPPSNGDQPSPMDGNVLATSGSRTPPDLIDAVAQKTQHTTPLATATSSTGREGSSDIDQLTASVKKITLKLSDKDKRELQSTANSRAATQARPPPKKASAARTAKTITPKTSTVKMARTAKSTPSTPLTNITTSTENNDVVSGMAAARALSEEAQGQASAVDVEIQEVPVKSVFDSSASNNVASSDARISEATNTLQPVQIDAPLNFVPPITDIFGQVTGVQRSVSKEGLQLGLPTEQQQEFGTTATIPEQLHNFRDFQQEVSQTMFHQTQKEPVQRHPPVFTSHGPIPFGKADVTLPALAPVQQISKTM